MNLVTVKKMNDMLGAYQPVRTEWVDDSDANAMVLFIQQSTPVPGFFIYSLTLQNKQQYTLETPCADLVEYVRYCKSHPGRFEVQRECENIDFKKMNTIQNIQKKRNVKRYAIYILRGGGIIYIMPRIRYAYRLLDKERNPVKNLHARTFHALKKMNVVVKNTDGHYIYNSCKVFKQKSIFTNK